MIMKCPKLFWIQMRAWGSTKGMKGIHGPLGFIDLDSESILAEGFDHLPTIISAYNYAYLSIHMEKLGFEKAIN
jgi:hypothetical protein